MLKRTWYHVYTGLCIVSVDGEVKIKHIMYEIKIVYTKKESEMVDNVTCADLIIPEMSLPSPQGLLMAAMIVLCIKKYGDVFTKKALCALAGMNFFLDVSYYTDSSIPSDTFKACKNLGILDGLSNQPDPYPYTGEIINEIDYQLCVEDVPIYIINCLRVMQHSIDAGFLLIICFLSLSWGSEAVGEASPDSSTMC